MIPDMPRIVKPDYRGDFNAKAAPLVATLNNLDRSNIVSLKPRRFPSGAVGWSSGSQTCYIKVGDRVLQCKATLVIKVVGSKGWPETGELYEQVQEAGSETEDSALPL